MARTLRDAQEELFRHAMGMNYQDMLRVVGKMENPDRQYLGIVGEENKILRGFIGVFLHSSRHLREHFVIQRELYRPDAENACIFDSGFFAQLSEYQLRDSDRARAFVKAPGGKFVLFADGLIKGETEKGAAVAERLFSDVRTFFPAAQEVFGETHAQIDCAKLYSRLLPASSRLHTGKRLATAINYALALDDVVVVNRQSVLPQLNYDDEREEADERGARLVRKSRTGTSETLSLGPRGVRRRFYCAIDENAKECDILAMTRNETGLLPIVGMLEEYAWDPERSQCRLVSSSSVPSEAFERYTWHPSKAYAGPGGFARSLSHRP